LNKNILNRSRVFLFKCARWSNQRPAWLVNAHRTLDAAVASAYGWPADLSDAEVLRRLLALNRERAGA
jgi:hypothetical protein